MYQEQASAKPSELAYEEPLERVAYDFGLNRRSFVQFLGTGLLIAVSATPGLAQRSGGRRGAGGARNIAARIHIGKDGTITVMTGKVEGGQGARAELSQAAAEELRVSSERIQLIMADTDLVPDDGITAGSRSTPGTVPAIREGAAAAKELLIDLASKRWQVERGTIQIKNGAVHDSTGRTLTYADLVSDETGAQALQQAIPPNVEVVAVTEWKVLGNSKSRPNGRDIVTGTHKYPSDIKLPGMHHGKIMRPPAYGAKLASVDAGPAKALRDVTVVQDDQFVGVVAPDSLRADQALDLLAKTAKWDRAPHPSSKELFDHLKQHARDGIPANPFAEELSKAKQVLKQSYHVAYAQHAPLEPRVAVADWKDGKLTVWTGTQNPFGVRSELGRAFHLSAENVRVIVPDFGAGYGGKHTGEAAVEAARLAQGAGKPVSLRWTREEEFTWAYFRPAALIEVEASLDENNALTSWHFINVNSGGSAVETPYRTGKNHCQFVNSEAPLRQGSYRALASTANNFARESFMDELATAAKADPLAFRLAHLENPRLRAVLEQAAKQFGWEESFARKTANVGVGLACGTEKGSYVAACAEIEINQEQKTITVRRVCQAFECGAIMNPENLQNQVQGAIIMGLGPALREEMRFENGEMLNPSFRGYPVPRFADVPQIDIHLLNRPDLASVGAGETPIIAVAPAISNALFHATGVRVREMPIRLPEKLG
jgi:isoquinoline 1-oxidoreductase